MNADQLKQKAKELKEIHNLIMKVFDEIDSLILTHNVKIRDKYKILYTGSLIRLQTLFRKQAKDLLTSIENGEIEGCEKEFPKEFYYSALGRNQVQRLTCGWFFSTSQKREFCPSCQQKINEAEKILREVLE